LAVADLESHITSQTTPEDAEKEQAKEKPRDFPANRLFHAAATKELTTHPVVKCVPKFTYGEGGVEIVSEAGPSALK
jgi:hypothetical protein